MSSHFFFAMRENGYSLTAKFSDMKKRTISPEERAAILALNSICGFIPRKGRQILEQFDQIRPLFFLDSKELERIGLEEKIIQKMTPQKFRKAQEELEKLEHFQSHFITLQDTTYPPLLEECADAPIGIYLESRSNPEEIFTKDRPAISIVGTRDISPYGKEICIQLVRALSRMRPKPIIVSGLALGVDITAHKAALENGLPTLAVMATGVDSIYPFCHGWVAEKIVQSPCSGLVTDYPPQTRPQALNFIRRNRILAGLSNATILIESKIKGGGLITAKLASSYDRDVYAVPGRITDLRSQGCNYLIRKNIAVALTDLEQLTDDLGWTLGCQTAPETTDLISKAEAIFATVLTPDELHSLLLLLKTIRQEMEIPQESLASACHLAQEEADYLTGLLESEGFIHIDLLRNCSINEEFV